MKLFELVINLGLKKKLYFIFGFIMAATALGVAVGVFAFNHVQVGGTTYGVIERNMLIADNIAKLRANLAFVRTALLTMIFEESGDRRQELRDDVEALSVRIDELFDIIDDQLKTTGKPEAKQNMRAARAAWNEFKQARDKELMPAIFAARITEAMALARGIQADRYAVFSDETKSAVDQVRGDVPLMVERMKRQSNLVKSLFIAGGAVLVAFYAVVVLFFSRNLIAPVVKVAYCSSKMAQGDFLDGTLRARGADEIGAMITNFSTMSVKVSDTALRLRSSIMNVSSSSERLSATAEKLNKGTELQTNQAREVTAATNQMSDTIADVARTASQAAEAAKNSLDAAASGKEIVEMTAERLALITDTVSEASRTIEGLSKSSGQIGEIVNLIHTIADQTNLLALNAAIEAARAGEQGKGFAVVADEVRKLADRTTGATRDIEQKISAIQTESGKSLAVIKKGSAEVEKGMGLARSASQALDTIVKDSNQLMDMVQRIAAATEEQSASSEEISRNMQGISGLIENTSDATREIRQAAQDLAKLSRETEAVMAWFKTKEQRLPAPE